uniref:SOCS box domain-containing protein n=1 Tax=Neogobius melanostomus TaxID=47308 RepID=A0A8C6UHL3_9GOBI
MDFSESYSDSVGSVSAAARSGSLAGVRTLIQAGLSLDVRDNRGWTCLHEGIASQEGHEEVVAELLANRGNPNKMCLNMWRWPELPIHAAAQFGHIGVLKRLIPVTDRCIDRGLDQVSPVYMSVMSDQRGALQLLLADGFSPDAQDSEELLGLKCPLSLALFLSFLSLETVRILLSAGATTHREIWAHTPGPGSETPGLGSARALTEREVEGLVKECGSQVQNSSMWMPLLLKEQIFMMSKTVLSQGSVYLIFSSLSAESIPSLFHLCRLLIRDVLGSASVTKTTVLDQLPVPLLFHHFLQFKDVQ